MSLCCISASANFLRVSLLKLFNSYNQATICKTSGSFTNVVPPLGGVLYMFCLLGAKSLKLTLIKATMSPNCRRWSMSAAVCIASLNCFLFLLKDT